jgi:hypothetical protein
MSWQSVRMEVAAVRPTPRDGKSNLYAHLGKVYSRELPRCSPVLANKVGTLSGYILRLALETSCGGDKAVHLLVQSHRATGQGTVAGHHTRGRRPLAF